VKASCPGTRSKYSLVQMCSKGVLHFCIILLLAVMKDNLWVFFTSILMNSLKILGCDFGHTCTILPTVELSNCLSIDASYLSVSLFTEMNNLFYSLLIVFCLSFETVSSVVVYQ
jgi:hypothetical protein